MEPKYVPIEDVAKHFSVSISTIRAWVRQDQIPQDTTKKTAPEINDDEDEVMVEPVVESRVATDEDADLLELLDEDQ